MSKKKKKLPQLLSKEKSLIFIIFLDCRRSVTTLTFLHVTFAEDIRQKGRRQRVVYGGSSPPFFIRDVCVESVAPGEEERGEVCWGAGGQAKRRRRKQAELSRASARFVIRNRQRQAVLVLVGDEEKKA